MYPLAYSWKRLLLEAFIQAVKATDTKNLLNTSEESNVRNA